ncbi:2OG-Fe(II) oxygenase [Pseudomarimonas arenosa]|uniref:2OG-Fe(II) oxygenase n=1 Tax=Pseudomarimonas arenosa TaxID=2774145 RepID=A0AAW3ZQC0_9GAMM|nr:2OG-Fe(II) oxygenase [Pseudomarimonas arenosa]MBD8527735.1 2OG-Fe(II) oxygenase [Pseudomarimonas arenosa]
MLRSADLDALRQRGYCLPELAIESGLLQALATDARCLHDGSAMQAARIGRADQLQARPDIRSDLTFWIDADPAAPARGALLTVLEQLRHQLNRELLLGLADVETHYAAYPPGAFYRRHLDRFRSDDKRTLSFTLYLNQTWTAADGGALRLWLPEGPLDVLPTLGCASLFLSDEIEHEVLPAQRNRYSIAAWFRRR